MALRRIAVAVILLCTPMFAESKKQEAKLEPEECCLRYDQCICAPIPNPWCNSGTIHCSGFPVRQDPISNVERSLLKLDLGEKKKPLKIEGLFKNQRPYTLQP